MSRVRSIIVSSLTACALLYLVEQVLAVDYLIKTLTKVTLFTLIPWAYSRFGRDGSSVQRNSDKTRFDKSSIRSGLLLGTAAALVILLAYSLLQGALDLPAIARELQEKSKITPANFLLVGLYITLGNSFLEESFFRGFIFLSLYQQGSEKLAYIYSSMLFGLYHVAIFQSWFNPWLIGLALIGLVTIGFVFDWLNAKTGNFLNSWLTHALADAAIMLIGMRMFNLI